MNTQLKYYKQEGNVYVLRQQLLWSGCLTVFVVALGTAILVSKQPPLSLGKILFASVFFVFALMILYRLTARVCINPRARTISVQTGAKLKTTVYGFEDFQKFNVNYTRINGIRTNTSVSMTFLKDGKENNVRLRQYFVVTSPIQKVIDETESILKKAVEV